MHVKGYMAIMYSTVLTYMAVSSDQLSSFKYRNVAPRRMFALMKYAVAAPNRVTTTLEGDKHTKKEIILCEAAILGC